MERQLAARAGERRRAELVEDDGLETSELGGERAGLADAGLLLEPGDEVDGVDVAATGTVRTTLEAIALARWVLPVPVTLTSTTLRRPGWNEPLWSERTSPSLIGVPSNTNAPISLTCATPSRRAHVEFIS